MSSFSLVCCFESRAKAVRESSGKVSALVFARFSLSLTRHMLHHCVIFVLQQLEDVHRYRGELVVLWREFTMQFTITCKWTPPKEDVVYFGHKFQSSTAFISLANGILRFSEAAKETEDTFGYFPDESLTTIRTIEVKQFLITSLSWCLGQAEPNVSREELLLLPHKWMRVSLWSVNFDALSLR